MFILLFSLIADYFDLIDKRNYKNSLQSFFIVSESLVWSPDKRETAADHNDLLISWR